MTSADVKSEKEYIRINTHDHRLSIAKFELSLAEEGSEVSYLQSVKESIADQEKYGRELTLQGLQERRAAELVETLENLRLLQGEAKRGTPFVQPECDSTSSVVRCDYSTIHKTAPYVLGGISFYAPGIGSVESVADTDYIGDPGTSELSVWPAEFSCAAGQALPSGTF